MTPTNSICFVVLILGFLDLIAFMMRLEQK